MFQIIHEDDHLIVVNKASGFLSVPGRGPEKIDSVAHRVRQRRPDAITHPAVHRLDMDTSGLLVLAYTAEAHRHLSRQFQERQTQKTYHSLLDGTLPPEKGTHGRIELPFRLDIDNRPYQIHDPIHGKIGLTHWRLLANEPPHARIEFTPHTGRTHQLRVHAAHPLGLGLPIVGDPLYGNGSAPGQLKLHATTLSFTHPHTLETLTFTTPVPF
ncbi:MAG: RluA family pseudouridine synthase [Verrucomicrobiales bacterium]